MLSDTELRLSFWRHGSTQAERFAASALRLSGYEEIDPQHPLGGPDGGRDILCEKGGLSWVGAVYFPTGPAKFPAIKKKYSSDLLDVPPERQGFVFVTNQTLSQQQRSSLTDIARNAGKEGDILHLQQLVILLDSAPGYGARLEYLNIPMTIEDQLAWFLNSDSQVAKALSTNTRELLALRATVERLRTDQTQVFQTLGLAMPGAVATPDLISASSFQKSDGLAPISAELSPSLLLLFHRLTCFDLPTRAVGQLRTNQVWLANREGQRVTHVEPPAATEVEGRLGELCNRWNVEYPRLFTTPTKLAAIAKFHAELLLIHPFFDGNGRVARAILMQQCLDLFGRADMRLMNKGTDYYQALRRADTGNHESLVALIDPVVHG